MASPSRGPGSRAFLTTYELPTVWSKLAYRLGPRTNIQISYHGNTQPFQLHWVRAVTSSRSRCFRCCVKRYDMQINPTTAVDYEYRCVLSLQQHKCCCRHCCSRSMPTASSFRMLQDITSCYSKPCLDYRESEGRQRQCREDGPGLSVQG